MPQSRLPRPSANLSVNFQSPCRLIALPSSVLQYARYRSSASGESSDLAIFGQPHIRGSQSRVIHDGYPAYPKNRGIVWARSQPISPVTVPSLSTRTFCESKPGEHRTNSSRSVGHKLGKQSRRAAINLASALFRTLPSGFVITFSRKKAAVESKGPEVTI